MRGCWPLMLIVLSLAAGLMWLTGYFYYTSMGIDTERENYGSKISTHYRVRWPGNGSIWIGGGRAYGEMDWDKPLQRIDPAGVFFQSPRRPESQNIFNTLGFWRVRTDTQSWIGFPAWLPFIFFASWAYWEVRHYIRRRARVANL